MGKWKRNKLIQFIALKLDLINSGILNREVRLQTKFDRTAQ